ncbi:adenylate/guanylate cyclase domain-containing protein [Mycolicibacterium brumae]|uniref:Adenylate/guanylate cyclase domain-containing protein n=1 Tax=Mycolicibacterium brumae TaxID=85968 RepID=A0A2G5PH37_9MYCO|nr:adenylate/guanylate cyclase domain-containing protein [Mycolicibacterium brumae]MCV7192545.1 adenylate/guanylate cyclase domain-containing protein [Mycolicibacterium brumae]PIB77460.1 adenylate/guanylate cyclase domain-containing protein [Mycolicibacterium brumae]RWA18463.1 hypothetical protein MBRU_04400 [Mycolicibacterium brumae DSM 44177]UWW10314.1 adenylate/guanylate cyclase domain-containing protein [Mycolicibacterium brumae]
MDSQQSWDTAWIAVGIVGVLALAAVITLSVLLIVARKQLRSARAELDRIRDEQGRRRKRIGLAPLAVKTVWETGNSLITKGIGATVRNSIEDLAGWAKVERPDLARITADGEVVIAFSDIEGSTELNETLGDREWVKVLDRHNKLVTRAVENHGGHVVKNQGDGFMIAFADPAEAVRACVDVQHDLETTAIAKQPIRVRMGLHQGSSVRRGDDLFGRNVAMAARVAAQASGGQILISQPVRDAVADTDIEVGEPRTVELKGIRGSQDLYPVLIPELATS